MPLDIKLPKRKKIEIGKNGLNIKLPRPVKKQANGKLKSNIMKLKAKAKANRAKRNK